MGLFKRLKSVFKIQTTTRDYWFYVKCDHCNEVLKGRVDLYNHLSIQYGDGKDENMYYCRKVMIGNKRCFRPMEVEFWFDANRRLLDRQIKDGQFVSEDKYLETQN